MDKRFQPVIWLQTAGYKTYLVGNQVRNILLDNRYDPKDIDIATSALPNEIVAILRSNGVLPTHIDDKFGVVAFQLEGSEYEITTFRKDVYDPNFDHIRRTPREIIFIKDIGEDAERRDFTINAIYLNPKTSQCIDPMFGKKDLEDKILRFIGDPEIRIKEDPVRVLRAIRFKYSLGLQYAPDAYRALLELGKLVHKLSSAILKQEFHKIQNLSNYQLARKEMERFGIIPRF